MRREIPLVTLLLLALGSVGAIYAQITSNPIAAPVEKRGLQVEVRDIARLPDSRDIRPRDQDVAQSGYARVSYVRDLPDGRRFVNDSRGVLYLLANGQPSVYWNYHAGIPHGVYNRLERLHRVRLPSRICEERSHLHGAQRAGDGEPREARFHPAGIHASGCDLSQRVHGVASDQSCGEHLRGQQA